MSVSFRDELTRLTNPTLAGAVSKEIEGLAASLADVFAEASANDAKKLWGLVLAEVIDQLLFASVSSRQAPPAKTPVPPELIQKALREFDDKAIVEEIGRLRQSGGLTIEDFYPELEQLIRRSA